MIQLFYLTLSDNNNEYQPVNIHLTEMLLSMTGFGKSVVETEHKKITVEIKSLNSKQLDMSLRIPSAYREVELEMRNRLARRIERGKVEAIVTVENISSEAPTQFNLPLLKAYKKSLEEIAEAIGAPQPADWLPLLMRLPDIMKAEAPAEDGHDESDALIKAVDAATDALVEYRREEGRKLEEFFTQRIRQIESLLTEVPRYENERVSKIRSRIEDNLGKLGQVDIDLGRLEQEMIYYIEKLDINEEKQRLRQHLTYFMETLDGETGQGKKLGFISQEMGREINTLGSKSNHAELQKIVVRMKDELEQIKEQVLNVL